MWDDDGDFEDDMAKEISQLGMELLENYPAAEQLDMLIDIMVRALSGQLLAFKIINPNFTHKQLLEEVCLKLKQDFFLKAGRDDFVIDRDCVN
jgi:hypothetical protein